VDFGIGVGLEVRNEWVRRATATLGRRARKKSDRERSSRQPPEEAPRQPAAVIEDDFHRSLLRHWPSIWNHSNHAFL
jgi:hypothetical protein